MNTRQHFAMGYLNLCLCHEFKNLFTFEQRMEESYGETKIVDLIDNGADIYVKRENR